MSNLVALILSFSLITTGCALPDHFGRTTGEVKCGFDKFACKSGECIEDMDVCDGTIDCADRSDETLTLCKTLPCPSYAFRCSYGACINGNLKCDGQTDCVDNSDETSCI